MDTYQKIKQKHVSFKEYHAQQQLKKAQTFMLMKLQI